MTETQLYDKVRNRIYTLVERRVIDQTDAAVERRVHHDVLRTALDTVWPRQFISRQGIMNQIADSI